MDRFSQIAHALEDAGWAIEKSELASDCWWAKEIWELRSEWSPKGTVLFLTLLIDPEGNFDENRLPDSAVWAVALSKSYPQSRNDKNSFVISIKKRMNEAILEAVAISNDLRMGV